MDEQKPAPWPAEYRPPIESTCSHGKTIGPCPLCADGAQREDRAARRA